MHDFSYYLQAFGEFGEVSQVTHPIVTAKGLSFAKQDEVVLFESGQLGQVFSLSREGVDIVVFSQDEVKVGMKLVRINGQLTIPVGEHLLGAVISPLGVPISRTSQAIIIKEERPVDVGFLGIARRAKIKKPFRTGTALVDMMMPLGVGQKELIIGDRKTGKSSFVYTVMKQQLEEGAIVVYAAIGKRKSDIKYLQELLSKEGMNKHAIIVASSSSDSPGLINITPYAAMTIAEYFRDIGHNVLVILDDMSTHARFYREISLVAKNFPGRDSYPGDIFYAHAKLLERAGNFNLPGKGEAAITCLPIAESIEGDLTSYILTNLMGITDGHIFFDNNIFSTGRRPAVNTFLSVTRVGRQTQSAVAKSITREITSFLTLYEKVLNLSHFGSELMDSVKKILSMGEKIYIFFDQPYTLVIPEEVQLVLFALVWLDFPEIKIEQLEEIRVQLTNAYQKSEHKALLQDMLKTDTFNGLLRNVAKHKERIMSLWQSNNN